MLVEQLGPEISQTRSSTFRILLTCSSTSPPSLELAVTKAVTSPSISSSNSSIDRGNGSGAGAVTTGAATIGAAATGVAARAVSVEVGTGVCDVGVRALESEPSTDVAMSSNLEVAASRLCAPLVPLPLVYKDGL